MLRVLKGGDLIRVDMDAQKSSEKRWQPGNKLKLVGDFLMWAMHNEALPAKCPAGEAGPRTLSRANNQAARRLLPDR